MKTWLQRAGLGLALGLAALLSLPGHPHYSFSTSFHIGVLSIIGSILGGIVADRTLPHTLRIAGGLLLAAIGTIAALLVEALLAP